LAQKDPLSLIDDGHLTVKTKTGEMKPFVLNRPQKIFLDRFRRMWQEDKIIRILLLKARQMGFSTLIEAIIFVFTAQKENQNSTIIADDLKGSNYILEMSKLYQEKCPPHLRREIKKSNEKKLEFADIHSQIIVDTAENPDAGRKYTFRLVHLSEYAFFSKPKELMLGLSQSVPALSNTMIIKESTANGFNHFKDEWDDAEEGRTDYIPMFFAWFLADEYVMPVPDDFILCDPDFGEITRDELLLRGLMEKENVENIYGHLMWRRWCIRNNCGGDLQDFKQEYPSTADEAFIASGECFFSKEKLVKQLIWRRTQKELFKANIVKVDNHFELRKMEKGDYVFYEEPQKGAQYCIGGDACSGSGADYAALVARNKLTNGIVAILHAKIDPDELAERAYMLGSILNQAIVAIENDKFGFSANKKLKEIYGNIYVQRTFNKIENKIQEKYGWDTTAITRPLMLAQTQEEIRENAIELMDVPLIKECLTLIKNPKTKKVEAQEGCHDDLVIACCISGQIRHELPYQPPQTKKPGRDLTHREKNAKFKFRKRN